MRVTETSTYHKFQNANDLIFVENQRQCYFWLNLRYPKNPLSIQSISLIANGPSSPYVAAAAICYKTGETAVPHPSLQTAVCYVLPWPFSSFYEFWLLHSHLVYASVTSSKSNTETITRFQTLRRKLTQLFFLPEPFQLWRKVSNQLLFICTESSCH